MNLTERDWETAIWHGQYSQGDDREDLVTFRRVDLASFLDEIRHAQPPTLCSNELREAGKAYPRTCPECYLGPCKRPYTPDAEPKR